MPEMTPPVRYHSTLEWWRRLGLGAAQNYADDSIKWRPIIFFGLLIIATLVAFVVLCFNVVPGGVNAWTSSAWGGIADPYTCETVNVNRMIRQMFTAISAFGYALVGLSIGLLTYLDIAIVWSRFTSRRKHLPQQPFSKGPQGNSHVKVTAIATLYQKDMMKRRQFGHHHHHPNFVSVDPEYLRGASPALLRREPYWGILFSLTINFLAVASYLSHASVTTLAQRLEGVAWFSVILSFTCYVVARTITDGASPRVNMCGWFECLGIVCRVQCDASARDRGSRWMTYFFISVAIALICLSLFVFDPDTLVTSWIIYTSLAIVAFVAISFHYLGRKEEIDTWYELGLFSVVLMGIALLFKRYDLIGLCVSPDGYFQAHAVWQAMSASAIGLAYLALRSDMWMYDLVKAKEVRRHEGMDEAYRVPGMDVEFDNTTEPSRPATLERDVDNSRRRGLNDRESSNSRLLRDGELPERRRTLDRENSGSSRDSDRRIDQLRAQAKERQQGSLKKATQRTLDSADSEMDSATIGPAYWTCPECAYEDNELQFLNCDRCGAERPPLDEFVPMSVVQGYL